MSNIAFTIPGIPQQQGSKRPVGRSKAGRAIMIEDNANLAPWRSVAIHAARQARPAGPPPEVPIFTSAVDVWIVCYFPRPKSHYRTGKHAGELRDDAPTWHPSTPDLDKIQRAVGDVLTQAHVLRDDALIAKWTARKRYGDPRVEVSITSLVAAS